MTPFRAAVLKEVLIASLKEILLFTPWQPRDLFIQQTTNWPVALQQQTTGLPETIPIQAGKQTIETVERRRLHRVEAPLKSFQQTSSNSSSIAAATFVESVHVLIIVYILAFVTFSKIGEY